MERVWTHIPVLPEETIAYLSRMQNPERMLDGTLGCGGHSAMMLKAFPNLQLLGIDRDDSALQRSAANLEFAQERVKFCQGNYSQLDKIARENGWEDGVDALLLDIGVSSPQIDDPERGFSWRNDGPLDMRMDKSSPLTASRIVNRCSEEELKKIFREYGEIRQAGKLASAIVRAREERPLATTGELVELVESVLGRSRPGILPTPTLVFQALRIAVNDELGELEQGLSAAMNIVREGGIIVIISFHSLEDRIVKNFFRERARGCICPPGLPVCCCNHSPEVEILTPKVVTASEAELKTNRRSAPARLRAVRKLTAPAEPKEDEPGRFRMGEQE